MKWANDDEAEELITLLAVCLALLATLVIIALVGAP